MERNNQEEIYHNATLKTIQAINSKFPQDSYKRHTVDITQLCKDLKDMIVDANPLAIHRSSKYAQYLSETFLPKYYELVEQNNYCFLDVLEQAGMIGSRDAESLFERIFALGNSKAIEEIKKNIPSTDSGFKKESLLELNNVLERILYEQTQRISQLNSDILASSWGKIVDLFQKIDFPAMTLRNVKLVKYGSSQNKFQVVSSDIDMTLLTECYVDERILLKAIKEYFDEFKETGIFAGEVENVDNNNVRIPHLIIHLKNIKFDLTVNNILGIMNTHLLSKYADIDERCGKLGVLIKLWATQNKICDGRKYISSYAYLLMVINYLQILPVPLLPSLQKLKDEEEIIHIRRILGKQEEENQTIDVGFQKDMNVIRKHMAERKKNTNSLAELLIGFFKWFQQLVDKRQETLLVKEGEVQIRKTSFRASKNDLTKNPESFVLSIQDPFDKNHDLGRNFRFSKDEGPQKVDEKYDELKKQIRAALDAIERFCQGKSGPSTITFLFT